MGSSWVHGMRMAWAGAHLRRAHAMHGAARLMHALCLPCKAWPRLRHAPPAQQDAVLNPIICHTVRNARRAKGLPQLVTGGFQRGWETCWLAASLTQALRVGQGGRVCWGCRLRPCSAVQAARFPAADFVGPSCASQRLQTHNAAAAVPRPLDAVLLWWDSRFCI